VPAGGREIMTLILTELSDAGIAMAADSKISLLKNGKLFTKEKNWQKLLKVPRIKAAISYWGSVGLIAPHPIRFDEWLQDKIENGDYADLRSLADYLADEMNNAAKGKPLRDEQGAGIHVAGFQQWTDGVKRPTFYHIHNVHGHVVFKQEFATVNGQTLLIKTTENAANSPRELFTKHDDFAPEHENHATLLTHLGKGYITFGLGCPWSRSKGLATGKTGPRGRLEPPPEAPCQRISIHLPDVVAYGAGGGDGPVSPSPAPTAPGCAPAPRAPVSGPVAFP
jgi:hypothetical protein